MKSPPPNASRVLYELRHVTGRYPSWRITESAIVAPGGREFQPCMTREDALRCATATYRSLLTENPTGAANVRAKMTWKEFTVFAFDVLARSADVAVVEDAGIALERVFEAVVFGIEWADVLTALKEGDA